MTDWTLRELHALTEAHLDSLYARKRVVEAPRGVWRGHFLCWIDNEGSRRPSWRAASTLAFRLSPFGIDFDRRLWFFFDSKLAIGHFDARVERSRWRNTNCVALHYEVSRLPLFVRGALYDEVVPISERTMLALGGVNAERGIGDHFYFALLRA